MKLGKTEQPKPCVQTPPRRTPAMQSPAAGPARAGSDSKLSDEKPSKARGGRIEKQNKEDVAGTGWG